MEAERDALAVLENEVCEDAFSGNVDCRPHVDALDVLYMQCKKVDEQVHRQEQQSVRLEEILAIVEWCEARRSAGQPLDIEEATKVFRDLQARFAEVCRLACAYILATLVSHMSLVALVQEFETYNLAYLAVAIVFPLVCKGWLVPSVVVGFLYDWR